LTDHTGIRLISLAILILNIMVTLKCELEVTQDHRKWCRSIDHVRLTIGRPL